MVDYVTSPALSSPKVVILTLPGTPLSSPAIPLDVFSSAATMCSRIMGTPDNAGFDVQLVSVDGKPVPVMGGASIGVHGGIDDTEDADLVVVTALIRDRCSRDILEKAIEWLKSLHGRGSKLASLCTGAFVLAATGLLDGKAATTHWGACRQFAAMFPNVRLLPHRLMTDESPLYTSGGSHGATDLCLYLVEKMLGRETALAWSRVLVKEYRMASQSPFAVFVGNRNHSDSDIARVQEFLEEGYAAPLTIGTMAKRAGLGKRTFERRFKTATGEPPLVYVQRLRIEAAKRMLEMGSDGVAQITDRVGYEDTATFSRLFSRYVGISPAAYRRRFLIPQQGRPQDAGLTGTH